MKILVACRVGCFSGGRRFCGWLPGVALGLLPLTNAVLGAEGAAAKPAPTNTPEKASSADAELRRVAENVLLHQRACGGWPKNYDREKRLSAPVRKALKRARLRNDTTIDNGATCTEIRLLARAVQRFGDERCARAALRGLRYLLDGQYENGGWPQCFPDPRGYARHLTFNDDAMIGVLRLLRDVGRGDAAFSFVPAETRARCREAVARGIECILRCQIRVNGRLTVWCAQHDPVTFAPRPARSYEPASLSGHESVGIVRFLMEIERPAPRVVEAIEAAVAWFETAKLEGIKMVRIPAPGTPRGVDRVVIHDPDAPPMWARFYDLQTGRPIFCGRDGIPRRTLAGISYERRNGYSWLGYYARDLLARDWPAWRRKQAAARNPRSAPRAPASPTSSPEDKSS